MKVSRRQFIFSSAAGALLLSGKAALPKTVQPTGPAAEPKSVHTWLDMGGKMAYAWDIDIRINDFPARPERRWLYYFSLQVNFESHDEWSHGGIQWSGTREFRDNNNKGINWGGGSDWAGYGGIGSTNTPFSWATGNWYRFRVWRLNKGTDGLYRWLFAVLDRSTGKEGQYGTVRTRSSWIKSAVVFTETGYGVECGTPRTDVEWKDPVFRTPGGETLSPKQGTATYNGTCGGAFSTQQGLISRSPLRWFHATNSRRTAPYGTRLWA